MGQVVCAVAGVLVLAIGATPAVGEEGDAAMATTGKTGSAFYPDAVLERARTNAARHDWARAAQEAAMEHAQRWLDASDDELWEFMFGPHIKRSWMVWSDGFCPACKNDVKMYDWEMEPWDLRWKVRCPHCKELFPKNDFDAFHRSGFDEHGVFHPERADRSLLFNAEHPDPADPLHGFGVDDGEGYVDDEGHRWRFIGAYLIYGQWKKLIVDGVVNLSAAYVATGDSKYAYKAALMLDRVADVFPGFDFAVQGIVYERKGDRGQVSTWHDACAEMHQLVLAYDRIFEGARDEEEALGAYLSKKAEEYEIGVPKNSWADIQQNIETRIFRDTLEHGVRIQSNYPTTDVALLLIRTVLDWPGNRDEVLAGLDSVINKATAVDGVSGEKGLAGYATISPRTLGAILSQFSLLEPEFLAAVYGRHPALHQTYRFHVDMWCMDEWYPQSGDTGRFGIKYANYMGVPLTQSTTVAPSMWTFLWDMYRLTGDPVFAQVVYNANGNSVEGLPYDLFGEDPAAMQRAVESVIQEAGPVIQRSSVNKQQWNLAILRSGEGENRRALWIDYDSHGAHSHKDGMNVGLFAKGLDLMPDFGYPPVGYGGWGAPKAVWYTTTAAHETVVVDGKNQGNTAGRTTFWADGDRFRAIRVSAPDMYGIERYERAVAMVDLDERDFYVFDCFFVSGGTEHAKFFHSSYGEVETTGLTLEAAAEYNVEGDTKPWPARLEMRNFRRDLNPSPGWSVDWTLEDVHGYLPDEAEDIHVRYTDLTGDAGVEAFLTEGWIDSAKSFGGEPAWIPRVMVRRQTDEGPLLSTFVSVIEPYVGASKLRSIRRVSLETMNARALPENVVGVVVDRVDGRTDVWLAVDGRAPVEMIEPDHDIHVNGEFASITLAEGNPERIVLCNSQWIRVGKLSVMLETDTAFVELIADGPGFRAVSGNPEAVEYVKLNDEEVPVE